MFDFKKLFFVMQILAPLSCVAMDAQDVMITQLPDDVLHIIARLVSCNSVKDMFRLALVNTKLRSIVTKDFLMQQLKQLTFEHLVRAVPYDHKVELANQAVNSLQITREMWAITGKPAVSRLAGNLSIPIRSMLNYTIYMGQHSLAKSLLEAGERYNDQSLLVAVAVNNIDAIKLLLEHGANPAKRYCTSCLGPVAWSACACGTSQRFTPLEFAYTGIARIHAGNASPVETKLYQDIYQLLCSARGTWLRTQCQYLYQLWCDGRSDKKKQLAIGFLGIGVGCGVLYHSLINRIV